MRPLRVGCDQLHTHWTSGQAFCQKVLRAQARCGHSGESRTGSTLGRRARPRGGGGGRRDPVPESAARRPCGSGQEAGAPPVVAPSSGRSLVGLSREPPEASQAPQGWREDPGALLARVGEESGLACGACPVRPVPGQGQVTVAVFGPDAAPPRPFPGTAAVHAAGAALKQAFGGLPLLAIVGRVAGAGPREQTRVPSLQRRLVPEPGPSLADACAVPGLDTVPGPFSLWPGCTWKSPSPHIVVPFSPW